jgi:uncharacterized membrane protein
MASEGAPAFLIEDIRKQREIAQKALEDAREIDALLKKGVEDAQLRGALERAKSGLIGVARELAANAANTSTSAISHLSRK